jgi:sugar phosphate isomerase/epimerase
MIKTLGVQLFTIRAAMTDEDSIRASFKKLKELGYDEAQTAGFFVGAEKFAQIAKETGLSICGTHCGFNDLIADPDKAMKEHELLGTTNIGIGGMPGPARANLDELKKFVEQANEFAEKINKHGFKFTYHNHSFEFAKLEGKRIMDVLVDGLNPKTTSFVLDTYWVQHGGGDVIAWMNKLAGRIDILHLKDMGMADKQFITEIGQGNINFDGIIETAEKIGVKHYVVEQDTCPGDPFDSLKISSEYIKAKYM